MPDLLHLLIDAFLLGYVLNDRRHVRPRSRRRSVAHWQVIHSRSGRGRAPTEPYAGPALERKRGSER